MALADPAIVILTPPGEALKTKCLLEISLQKLTKNEGTILLDASFAKGKRFLGGRD